MSNQLLENNTTTNDAYWDCNCEENYIHYKKKFKSCLVCGAHQESQPDSMQVEIDELKIYSVWSKEYINLPGKIFPSEDEFHGRYVVRNISELKKQLVIRGFNLKECHWELRKKKDD